MPKEGRNRPRGKHRPHKLIAFTVAALVTIGVWYADTYHRDQILPEQQYLQSFSMLKLIELNKKYGVASVMDLYAKQSPSDLASYLDKKTTVPVAPIFRVLEANEQPALNQLIVDIEGEKMIFQGLNRVDLAVASREYSNIQGVNYAEPNYIVELNANRPNPAVNAIMSRRIASQYVNISDLNDLPVTMGAANTLRWDQPGAKEIPYALLIISDSGADNSYLSDVESLPVLADATQGDGSVTGSSADSGALVIPEEGDDAPNGHGSHLAGIAKATSNEILRRTGLPADSKNIISQQKLFKNNKATASGIAGGYKAIEMYLDRALRGTGNWVVSLSASFGSANLIISVAEPIQNLLSRTDADVSMSAAVGNAGVMTIDFPASMPNVIAAMSINTWDTPQSPASMSSFSNYAPGDTSMVAAPGENIISSGRRNPITGREQRYNNLSGTSQSTPFVAVLISVVKQLYPGITTQAIIDACTTVINPGAAYPIKQISLADCR